MTPKAILIFLTHNNILIKIPCIQTIEYIENFIYLYVEILYIKLNIIFIINIIDIFIYLIRFYIYKRKQN